MMPFLSFLAFGLFVSGSLRADVLEPVPLWPQGAPEALLRS